jgi:hypothetical protein
METRMECIKCGDPDAFGRVVINRMTREEIGLLCERCESVTFGELLCDDTWHQQKGCAFCDNSGKYQLPLLECLIDYGDGSPKSLEYTTFDYNASLCKSHLSKILPPDVVIEDIASKSDLSESIEV